MNFIEFIKEASKNQPAWIEADVNEKSEDSIKIKGRPVELIPLSMRIVLRICDEVHMPISDYCDMLQKVVAHDYYKKRHT